MKAVILAAGCSKRFCPISFEKPKGLTIVKGEKLIERQINQLFEAGITDITVVTGYKAEQYNYLTDKYGVKLIVNQNYGLYNNTYSVELVKDILLDDDCYICASDYYYVDNPFLKRFSHSIYCTEIARETVRDDWAITTNANKTIMSIKTDCKPGDTILTGYAFLTKETSKLLFEEIDRHADKYDYLWEYWLTFNTPSYSIFSNYLENSKCWEFDAIEEIYDFDKDFDLYSQSKAIRDICKVFDCKSSELSKFESLNSSTNYSFSFTYDTVKYAYRMTMPNDIIDRNKEYDIYQQLANKDYDETTVYYSKTEHWKISSWINGHDLNYNDKHQCDLALQEIQKIHSLGIKVNELFDFEKEARNYMKELGKFDTSFLPKLDYLIDMFEKVCVYDNKFKESKDLIIFSHCDYWNRNIIYNESEDKVYVIDWEYATMSDVANDFAMFYVTTYMYQDGEIDESITETFAKTYLGDNYSEEMERHLYNYAYIIFFQWLLWSLYMLSTGADIMTDVLGYYNACLKLLDKKVNIS